VFDPETGRVTDREALRSIGFGRVKRRPLSFVNDEGNKVTEIVRDSDQSSGGFRVEHASGRVDASVTTRAVGISSGYGG
jgi:hypothetical protein